MKKKEINKLGGSLLLPSVQELAKESLRKVPPRYVRDRDEQKQHDVADPSFSSQVPIINLSNLCSPDLKASELPKFHSACQQWGLLPVINHGVDESVVGRVKKGVKEFFNLPMEEKKKYGQTEEDVEGFVKSEEQKLDWAGMFGMF
ncbi:hypothetical protein K1719_032973 [Acacia pycnantha]|nr:hypothetical protein K1719_043938 [Acacia pycnantha]KAI9084981.1 hypothetical protein K1719_032973 [Acacia pycnantha]